MSDIGAMDFDTLRNDVDSLSGEFGEGLKASQQKKLRPFDTAIRMNTTQQMDFGRTQVQRSMDAIREEREARNEALRARVIAAEDMTARGVAESVEMSRALGVPAEMVAAAPEVAKRERFVRDVSSNDLLASWILNGVGNAAYAREDPTIGDFLRDAQYWGSDLMHWIANGSPSRIVQNAGRSLVAGATDFNRMLTGLARAGADLFGGSQMVNDWDAYFKRTGEAVSGQVDEKGTVEHFINLFARSVPAQLANIMAGVYSGGAASAVHWWEAFSSSRVMSTSMAVMFAQIFGGQYGELRDKGVAPGVAAASAMANATIQAPMEAISLGKFLDIFKAKGGVQTMLKAFEASGTEFLTEFLQQAPEGVTNLWAEASTHGKNDAEHLAWFAEQIGTLGWWKELAAEGVEAGIVGAMWGGLGGAIRIASDVRAAEDAREFRDTVVAIQEKVAAIPTVQTAPEVVQSVVEHASPATAQTVTVPADDLLVLHQQGKVDATAIRGLGIESEEQLVQAAEEGRVLDVKLSEAMTSLDSAQFKAFADIMERRPGSGSYAAVVENGNAEAVGETLADVKADMKDQSALSEELSRVRAQLLEVGQSAEKADQQVALLGAWAKAMSEATGIDALSYVKRLTVKEGGKAGDAEARLGQPVNAGVDLDRVVPVTSISSALTTTDEREARKNFPKEILARLAETFSAGVVNADTGWTVKMGRKDIKEQLRIEKDFEGGIDQYEAIAALPELMANAVRVESHEDRHHRAGVKQIHRFFAPVRIDDRAYTVRLTVKEFEDGVLALDFATPFKLYHHRLEKKLAPTDQSRNANGTSPVQFGANSGVDDSNGVSAIGTSAAHSLPEGYSLRELIRDVNDNDGVPFDVEQKASESISREDAAGPETGDPVAGPVTLYQWQNLPEWKIRIADWMRSDGRSEEEIASYISAIEGQMKIYEALGPRIAEQVKGAGQATRVKRSGGIRYSGPIRSNADEIYMISFDASSMCVKRLSAAKTAHMAEQQLGRPLTVDEQLALIALNRAAGKEAPCIYCYVESNRRKATQAVGTAREIIASGKIPAKWGKDRKAKAQAAIDEFNKAGLTRDDVNADYVLLPEAAATDEAAAAKERFPAIYDFMNTEALATKQNQVKLYEEYRGELLEMTPEQVEMLNGYAGVRFFSSSDFQVEHVVDLMQAMWDMKAMNAKTHGYTKVPLYVDIFGDTGQKINMSCFAEEDPVTGEIRPDVAQGWDWEEARRQRELHPDVGVVFVTSSDKVLRWAMEQDWVDYCIPFHYSGLEKKYYETLGWQDSTATQTEQFVYRDTTPKGVRAGEVKALQDMDPAAASVEYARFCFERKAYPIKVEEMFTDIAASTELSGPEKRAKAQERFRAMVESGTFDASAIAPDYFTKRLMAGKTTKDKPIYPKAVPRVRMHEMGTVEGISDAQGTRNYLELCLERKLYPVFPNFVFKESAFSGLKRTGDVAKDRKAEIKAAKELWKEMVDRGEIDWSLVNPNAFKFKKDYARTDTPFNVVEPERINVEAASVPLQETIDKGLDAKYQGDPEIAARLVELSRYGEEHGVAIGTRALAAARAKKDPMSEIMGTEPMETHYRQALMPMRDVTLKQGAKESGPSGAEADANYRNGMAAMDRVLTENVDVMDAMHREEVGDIAFMWGTPGEGPKLKKGFGLSHLIGRRNSQGEDGETVARKMVEVIAYGVMDDEYGPENGRRRNVHYDGHTAVLSLFRSGERQTWLVTGWKDYSPGGEGTVNGSTPTQAGPSGIRGKLGAGNNDSISLKQDVGNTPEGGSQKKNTGGTERGSFFSGRTADVIEIFRKAADASTVPHEMLHFFLNSMMDMTSKGNEEVVRERLRQDLAAAGFDLSEMEGAEHPFGVEEARALLEKIVADREARHESGKTADNAVIEGERLMEKALRGFIRHVRGMEQMRADLRTLREWSGVPVEGELTVDQYRQFQEACARGFEQYLLEGKAPTARLAGVFSRMKKWLLKVYASIREYVGLELNDDVRRIYDRMLATQEEIEDDEVTQAALSAEQAFLDIVNLSEEDVAELDRLRTEAENAATEQLDRKRLHERNRRWKAAYDESLEALRNEPFWILVNAARKRRQKSVGGGTEMAGGINKSSLVEALGPELAADLQKAMPGLVNAKDDGNALDVLAMESGEMWEGINVDQDASALANMLYERIVTNGETLEGNARAMADAILSRQDEETDAEEAFLAGDEYGEYLEAVEKALSRAGRDTQPLRREKARNKALREKFGEEKKELKARYEAKLEKMREASSQDEAAVAARREERAALVKDYAAAARKELDSIPIRDISLGKYMAALRKALHSRNGAILSGDVATAVKHVRQARMAYALLTEARRRLDYVRKCEAKVKRLCRRKAGPALPPVQAELIRRVVETWGMGSTRIDKDPDYSDKGMQELVLATLGARSAEDLGNDASAVVPVFAAWILNETSANEQGDSMDYRDYTTESLQDLMDVIDYAAHSAAEESAEAKESLRARTEAVVDSCVGQMGELKERTVPAKGTARRRFSDLLSGLFAGIDALQWEARKADGFQNTGPKGTPGKFETDCLQPILDAENGHRALMKDMSERLIPLLERLGALSERLEKAYGKSMRILDANGVPVTLPESLRRSSGHSNWTADQIIALALNCGNEGNRQRITGGYADLGYTTIEAILGTDMARLITGQQASSKEIRAASIQRRLDAPSVHMDGVLTADDWQAVQGVWNAIGTLWPATADTHRRIYGFAPRAVDVEGFSLGIGGQEVRLDGGYYPIMYDPEQSTTTAEREERDDILSRTEAMFPAPAPKAGHTKARAARTSLPLRLDTSVLMTHVADATRFISFAEPVRFADRVSRNQRFAAAYERAFGQADYRAIRPNLKGVVRSEPAPTNVLVRLANVVRKYLVPWGLAYNAKVAILQTTALGPAMGDLGAANVLRGMGRMMAGRMRLVRQIWEVSPYMKSRWKAFDQDVMDAANDLDASKRPLKVTIGGRTFDWRGVVDFGMTPLACVDMGTSCSIWMAAYEKELNRLRKEAGQKRIRGISVEDGFHAKAVRAADDAVKRSNPDFDASSRSKFLRAQDADRLFNMFGSAVTLMAQRSEYMRQAFKHGKASLVQFSRFEACEMMLPGIMMLLILGLARGVFTDDDEDRRKERMMELLFDSLFDQYGMKLPVFGSLVTDLVKGAAGLGNNGRGPTLRTVFDTVFQMPAKALKAGRKMASGEADAEAAKDLSYALGDILSFIARVPASRLVRNAERGYDQWERGEGTPASMVMPTPGK